MDAPTGPAFGGPQIVTLTMNPALDITTGVHAVRPTDKLRCGGSGVGAGDAMVAAVAVGLVRGWPLVKSVRLGIAAGTAMLMTPGTAACDRADVERFFTLAGEPVDVSAAPATGHPATGRPATGPGAIA